VLILNTFGTVVVAEPERPEILGQNWSDRTYYRQILRSQMLGSSGPVSSDIVADGPGGAEVIVVAVPIIGPHGGFVGTIAGMFRVGAACVNALYSDMVKLGIGEGGSAYLVDGNGRVIYHTDTDRIADDFSVQVVVQQVLSGQVDAIRTRDSESRDIVASLAPVPGTSWGLVTQESWAALTSVSRGYGRFLLLLLALGLVVPALVTAVGVRRITQPILTAEQEQQKLAESLRRTGAALSSTLNYDEVLDRILKQIDLVVPNDAANIMLIEGDRIQLFRGLGYERFGTQASVSSITFDITNVAILQRMQKIGQPVAIPYVERDEEWVYSRPEHTWIKSYAGAPIRIQGQVVGFLNVNSTTPGFFNQAHAEQLQAFADQAAIAIQNARLYRQAQEELAERARAESELRKYQEHLEELVRERTAELAQATREAQEARNVAEAANRAKSTFLANMSHELRTPLNAIIGYSEMLMEDAEDEGLETFVSDLEKIHVSGKHLLTLINDILDLSKIEADRMELYLETFDVASMVKDVVSAVQPLVEKNANTLEVHRADDLGTMHTDLTKVRQSLFNLLSNAAKFTEGGTIRLDVNRVPVDDVDWFTFSVRDTGIGMTPEQMGKLFQAFSQVDASTTRKYGGSGLGLAITKRFCQMMGGDISVESEYGVGSTFTIRLPAKAVTRKAERAPAEPP
jgi:signal transduction histidine kinase